MKILIRMPNWLGDFIMALPVIESLSVYYSKAKIAVLCPKNLSSLLKNHPYVDEIFVFSKKKEIKKILKGSFDLGFLLTNSFSSALQFYRAGVKKRVGYASDFRSLLLTEKIPLLKKKCHQVEKYQYLIEVLNIPVKEKRPVLILKDPQKAERHFKKDKIHIAIAPHAAFGSAKCWPMEKYANLAGKLLEDERIHIFFLGDKKADIACSFFLEKFGDGITNLMGKTDLEELASILSLSDLLICNDSGPMHLAACLNTKIVALFGSTDSEVTGPYSKNAAVIDKKISCAPCFQRTCKKAVCMRKITEEEVLKVVKEKIYA